MLIIVKIALIQIDLHLIPLNVPVMMDGLIRDRKILCVHNVIINVKNVLEQVMLVIPVKEIIEIMMLLHVLVLMDIMMME
mmetsp:Transcript_1187/g.123  ORF Transcript_1187/g.123 Transcript_1187/m.123 type:complete len:80 (-) Transcript_1187:17-256(-)